MIEFLALFNDVVQATAVIFGSAVVLYNTRHVRRDRVTRAFSALLSFVVIVFLTELMASRTAITNSAEPWLRLGWVGIALVPAAQYHLSDALLTTTGSTSFRRRVLVRVCYSVGIVFIGLVTFSDLVVSGLEETPYAPHLQAGLFFPIFTLYFWGIAAVSIYNVWVARRRCVTTTTRKRMGMILIAFLAAPLGVFPYLQIYSQPELVDSVLFWLITIGGNLVVGFMFSLLTYYIAYFGAGSPDRVVRVRLFKFMARVPLAATIVLLVFVLTGRTSSLLGLPVQTAQAFAVTVTIILVEAGIHVFKRPLERLFHLNPDPEVRRIQQLSDRLLTTRDMQQFLESLLITTCEYLRTPTAFVAAITSEGAKLEVSVGPLYKAEALEATSWRELARSGDNSNGYAYHNGNEGEEGHNDETGRGHSVEHDLHTVNEFVIWEDLWIRSLYNRQRDALVGILGIQGRAAAPDFTTDEMVVFNRLAGQAASALEDRILQQEVFAAVEGLLPQITALQARRSAATYSGDTLLTAPLEDEASVAVLEDPNFSSMVRDALTHYWGGPKLTDSPLMRLNIVQTALEEHEGNPSRAMRAILEQAIERQRPEGERNMTTAEWILYNILELKFVQGQKVRDVARRLAMSESDLYRKQRVAIENVAQAIDYMEREAAQETL
jgi:hypothetical protein